MTEGFYEPTENLLMCGTCGVTAVGLIDDVGLLTNTVGPFIGSKEDVNEIEEVSVGLRADAGASLSEGA